MMCKPMLLCLVWAGALSVHAQPLQPTSEAGAACAVQPCSPIPAATPTVLPVGQATRSLLQRQAGGAEANPSPHAMSGVVAQKVYTRYVDSFAHPIPERAASPMALNAAKK